MANDSMALEADRPASLLKFAEHMVKEAEKQSETIQREAEAEAKQNAAAAAAVLDHRKVALRTGHVGRQDLDAIFAGRLDVPDHVVLGAHLGGQQCRHELHREIRFQQRRLVADDRVCGRV